MLTRKQLCSLTLFLAVMVPVAGASAPLTGIEQLAVSRITVDGYPIDEVPEGRILEQSFDEACKLTASNAVHNLPLAGSVTDKDVLHLEVEVAACAAGPQPEMRCGWEIEKTTRSGNATWTGLKGKLEVRLPRNTGIYTLGLNCSAAGDKVAPFLLQRTLFVTYGEPLSASYSDLDQTYTAPKIDWYWRACDWGAGFEADDEEEDVLHTMLGRLYDYGQEHWKYGSFPKEVPKNAPYQPECSGEGLGQWCKCSWPALVAEKTSCNFGSCYDWSKVFENIAATMGFGGFEVIRVVGAGGSGFVTLPNSRSFDPDFSGNVECAPGSGRCPAYLFGSHSLRLRDGIYYDATFNRTHQKEDADVLRNISSYGRQVTFIDHETVLCFLHYGYGTWGFYVQPPRADGGAHCPGEQNKGKTVTSKASYKTIDDDQDAHFESLGVDLEFEVEKAGLYTVRAQLMKGNVLISHKPKWESERFTLDAFSGPAGSHTAHLRFSGEDIFRSQTDGPYSLHFVLLDKDGILGSGETTTPAYDHQRFGELEAALVEIRPPAKPDAGSTEDAQVVVVVDVRHGDRFALQMRLSKGSRTLFQARRESVLEAGQHEVPLTIPFEKIAALESAFPFDATLVLSDSRLRTLDSRSRTLDSVPQEAIH